MITLTGIGTVIVKALQPGTASHIPAEATQTFVVEPAAVVKKEWDKTIGGDLNDKLISLQQTSDGGYILGGGSGSNISGDKTDDSNSPFESFWVVKLKANGSKEWDKTFMDYAGNPESFATIQQTSDGGYILGRSKADQTVYCDWEQGMPCVFDYWIIKLNPDGTTAWDKTYIADGNSELLSLQQTRDGGYILGGKSDSGKGGDKSQDSRGGDDYWIIKVNARGTKEWDNTYGGNNYDELESILQTSDGGYILGGSSASGMSGDKSEKATGAWLVKIKADGSKVWDKSISGGGLTALQQTRDGGYVLGSSGDDYRIIKLNALGNKEWEKTFGGNGMDNLSAVLQTKDGGYLLGGSSDSNPGGDKSEHSRGSSDFWLVKIKANGEKEWDKIFGGHNSDNLAELQNTSDGGYILGGTSTSNIYADKSEDNKGSCDESYCSGDYWIIKLKEEQPLTASWNMRYGSSGKDNLTTIIKTSDGGYLSGGYTDAGNSGDKSQSSQGKNDYWIVKSDKNGQKLWDKRFGGSQDEYLNRVIQTQDGGYLLGGSSLSGDGADKTQASQGVKDYWLVKVDQHGNKQWDRTFGGSGYDELQKVIQLTTGEYVLGGFSNSPLSGNKSQATQGGTDYWLVKISKTVFNSGINDTAALRMKL